VQNFLNSVLSKYDLKELAGQEQGHGRVNQFLKTPRLAMIGQKERIMFSTA
jgi:hypothetical protein